MVIERILAKMTLACRALANRVPSLVSAPFGPCMLQAVHKAVREFVEAQSPRLAFYPLVHTNGLTLLRMPRRT